MSTRTPAPLPSHSEGSHVSGTHRPLVLIILDGFGYREEKANNAIALANKPCWDKLWQDYPHTLLAGSGHSVGLPHDQMGNSEVGHMNMGAGRIVYQDLTRIDLAIENGDFFNNPTLIAALAQAKQTHKAVHILGLLSPGGVHSHEKHIHALVSLAATQDVPQTYIHAFLDGRDTPPRSAETSLLALSQHCRGCGHAKIASIIGRYYAMDRDKRWERIEKAYALLTEGKAPFHAATSEEGLALAYERGENDEFVQATSIHAADEAPARIQDGDIVIFMNFRSDRARELTMTFVDPHFTGFPRHVWPKLGQFVSLTSYYKHFAIPTAFIPEPLTHLFGEYISEHGLRQLRIAETEKYAHVTFFFNGGTETAYPNEDRVLIPSPSVTTYDLQPEMSAPAIADTLVKTILAKEYDVIICNFANADMVGHSGNLDATIRAVESIDDALQRIIDALLTVHGEAIITADHGNAEQMFDAHTQQAHTAHTSDPVPFLYIGRNAKIVKKDGKLSDIAPTMLYLLGLPVPLEMTGTTLLACI